VAPAEPAAAAEPADTTADDPADDRDTPTRRTDDSPSLLGGLTEPLGVSCSGSLLGSAC
jgi:hypothetical protein